MHSRERLLKTLSGEPVDRVPVSTYELCGYNSLAFENQEPSYRGLMDFIRAHTDSITMWNPSSNQGQGLSAYPTEVEKTTTRHDDQTITKYIVHTPLGDLTRTLKQFDNVHTVWNTEHLCKDSQDVDAYLSIPYKPVVYDYSDFSRIREEVGDQGIVMMSVADPACVAMEIMEFGDATVWAMTELEHFSRTLEKIHERNMENLKNMLDGGVADLYRIVGPEYITPPYLPPSYFKRFVVPYLQDMTRMIQRYGGKVRIHSHGKIAKVLDMIAEVGADALDPCEGPPDGDIPLTEIKRRVGDRMCLFGNLQLKLLEHGSTEAVSQEVAACMEAAKAGGRYVIMPTASPINVPLSKKTEDNYKVFIETALKLGKY